MAKRHYSLVVFAQEDVTVSPLLQLERGPNVFSVFVEDIEKFKTELLSKGVKIDRVHSLDDFEPVPPEAEFTGDETIPSSGE